MAKQGIDRKAFARRLRKTRVTAGLSQRELEGRSGVPKSRISRYENGHLLPSLAGLQKLADSLEVSRATLLGEREDTLAAFARALRERGVEFASVGQAEEMAGVVADELQEGRLARRRRG